MKGCRSLTKTEILRLKEYFEEKVGKEREEKEEDKKKSRRKAFRDYTLLFLGFFTGFRIQELLSIAIGDLYLDLEEPYVFLKRENTKGKTESRKGILSNEAVLLLKRYLAWYRENFVIASGNEKDCPLFPRKKYVEKGDNICTRQGWVIFKKAFDDCEIQGNVSCHTSRKTFASLIYKSVGNDIFLLKECLGHKSINSTCSYIQGDDKKIKDSMKNLLLE